MKKMRPEVLAHIQEEFLPMDEVKRTISIPTRLPRVAVSGATRSLKRVTARCDQPFSF